MVAMAARAGAALLLAAAWGAAEPVQAPEQLTLVVTFHGPSQASFHRDGQQWTAAPKVAAGGAAPAARARPLPALPAAPAPATGSPPSAAAAAGPPPASPDCAEDEEHIYHVGSKQWYVALCVSLTCLIVAACAAGLTISVSGLNGLRLEIMERVAEKYELRGAQDEELDEKDRAARDEFFAQLPTVKKLLPIVCGPVNPDTGLRGDGMWYWSPHGLLVTLLLVNAAANEILPLYLDHLLPHWAVIIVSITLVLIFGEILPSAVFSSNRLTWANRLYWLVQLLRLVTWPIALPIAKLLDRWLGHTDEEQMRKEELRALILMHKDSRKTPFSSCMVLRADPAPPDPQLLALNSDEQSWADDFCRQFPDQSLSRARFCKATYSDLVTWLERVVPSGTPPKWRVDQEPMATERRGQGQDCAWVSFRDVKYRDAALEKIAATQRRLFGWVPVVATACTCEEADSRFRELDHYEVEIMTAALDLDQKLVRNEISSDIWSLGHLDVLDQACRERIFQSGYSRIPVYNVHEAWVECGEDGSHGIEVSPLMELLSATGPAEKAGFLAGGWMQGGARRVTAVDGHPVHTPQAFQQAMRGPGPHLVRVDERDVVRGLLLVKSLAVAYAGAQRRPERVADRCLYPVSMIAVLPTDNLHSVLQSFQVRKLHIALVTDKPEDFENCWRELDVDMRGEEERTPLAPALPTPTPLSPSDAGTAGWSEKPPRKRVTHRAVQALREAAPSVYGVLTLEDVIEELVGDIDDEFDARNQAKARHRKTRNRLPHWQSYSYSAENIHRVRHRGSGAVAGRAHLGTPTIQGYRRQRLTPHSAVLSSAVGESGSTTPERTPLLGAAAPGRLRAEPSTTRVVSRTMRSWSADGSN